eukprot:scaffold2161_cov244-Pinguiococcus_pyrenoidosus.AAC.16
MWAAAVGLLPKPMLAGATPRGLSAVAALQSSAETETLQQETDTDSTIDPVLKAMAYHNHGVSLMRRANTDAESMTSAAVLVCFFAGRGAQAKPLTCSPACWRFSRTESGMMREQAEQRGTPSQKKLTCLLDAGGLLLWM